MYVKKSQSGHMLVYIFCVLLSCCSWEKNMSEVENLQMEKPALIIAIYW